MPSSDAVRRPFAIRLARHDADFACFGVPAFDLRGTSLRLIFRDIGSLPGTGGSPYHQLLRRRRGSEVLGFLRFPRFSRTPSQRCAPRAEEARFYQPVVPGATRALPRQPRPPYHLTAPSSQ